MESQNEPDFNRSPSSDSELFGSPTNQPTSPTDLQTSSTSFKQQPQSERKGKAKLKEVYGSVPILLLPTELLSHVFAHLSPSALNSAQLVCRQWNTVIDDEASWRSAFETYYGVFKHDGNGSVSLGRRLEPTSWKAEYRSRVSLLHRWSKSRTPALTHNPNVGPLSSMYINLPATTILPLRSSQSTQAGTPPRSMQAPSPVLVALSEGLGMAAQSYPFTGKVTRGALNATPVDNLGRPWGFAPVPVASSTISPDGTRLIFGMANGSIRIVSCGAAGRGVVAGVGERGDVRAIGNAHREGTEVVAVSFGRPSPQTRTDLFTSIGQDGQLVVWQLSTTSSARDRPTPATKLTSIRIDAAIRRSTGVSSLQTAPDPPRVSAVAFDPGWVGKQSRPPMVALGLSNGAIYAWTSIALEAPTSPENDASSFHVLESRYTTPIDVLELDYVPSSHRLLVHAQGQAEFSRFTLDDTAITFARSEIFGHPFKHLGELTAFAFDFEEPPAALVQRQALQKELRITGFTPNDSSTPLPSHTLSPSSSRASLASLSESTTSSMIPEVDLEKASTYLGTNTFGRRKFVVAGDASGRVHTWDWEFEGDASGIIIQPQRTTITSDSKVTALELSEAMVFVGSLDGTIRCYDSLTSTLLRTFKDRTAPRMPARMLAAGQIDSTDEDRWKVSHITANKEAIVAAIGDRILAWRTAADLGKKKMKGLLGPGAKMSARTERFRSGMELRSEIKDSIDSLSNESTDRMQRLANERRITSSYGLPPSLDNMTEDEAVALALMLSAEEEEARWFSDSASSSAMNSPAFEPVPEELLDMEGLLLDDAPELAYERPSRAFGNRRPSSSLAYGWDDEEEQEDGDEDHIPSPTLGSSRSLSLSVPTSPTIRGSSLSNGSPSPSSSRSTSFTWRPPSLSSPQHASPSFSSYHLSSISPHAKVQLSPRLGPTYGSANLTRSGPVPDMSVDLWPVASGSSSSSTSPSRSPTPLSRASTNRLSSTAGSSPSPKSSPSLHPVSSPCQGQGQTSSTSPSSGLSNPVSSTTPSTTTIKRGWNVVARSASASPTMNGTSPLVAIPSRSPSHFSPTSIPGRTSMLTERLRDSSTSNEEALARGIEQSRIEDIRRREEEDMRFAIELSLAEAASRQ